MDTNLIKIFRTVVDEGSISKAAFVLNYAQSNITARIKQLERELGKPLFYRHSKGVEPTSAGRVLYDYSEKILNLCDEIVHAVKNADSKSGRLKLGAIEEISTIKFPKLLSAYSKHYPDIDIDMTVASSVELIKLVMQDEIDGAYIVGPIDQKYFKHDLVMKDHLILVASKKEKNPITLRVFENERLLLTGSDCFYKEKLSDWFQQEGVALGKVMVFTSLEGMLGCVKEGIGITVIAKSLFDDLGIEEEVSWIMLPEEFGCVDIHFIMKRECGVADKLQTFIKSYRFE